MTEGARANILSKKVPLCELALGEVWHDHALYEGDDGEQVPGVAAQLYESAGASAWGDTLSLGAQSCTAMHGNPTDGWQSVGTSEALHLAPKPRGGLWTSTLIDNSNSAWSLFPESRRSQLWTPVADVTSSVVVLELNRPSHWVALCRSYPRSMQNGMVNPDWVKVANDYDAVHLTMGGLLSIQLAALIVDGERTVMSGWDVESTCWLKRPPIEHWRQIQ